MLFFKLRRNCIHSYLGANEGEVVGKAGGRADADLVRTLGKVFLVAELQFACK